jgi:hypothetical protein
VRVNSGDAEPAIPLFADEQIHSGHQSENRNGARQRHLCPALISHRRHQQGLRLPDRFGK